MILLRKFRLISVFRASILTLLLILCVWQWKSDRAILLPDKFRAFSAGKFIRNSDDTIMSLRKKHYHDYQMTQYNRTGPGEQGKAFVLTQEERKRAEELLDETGGSFRWVSDKISLDRAIPDVRPPDCRHLIYPKHLPTASVIIIFSNDAPSLLLRTVHGIVNRSPPEYLLEVLLVDDVSTTEELGKPLEDHLKQTWPDGLVRVVRTQSRQGVVGTRLVGIKEARGDVLIVLDGHMEVSPGWMEPILARLSDNPQTLVSPVLDVLAYDTFQYYTASIWTYIDFTIDMRNSYKSVPEKDRHTNESVPIRSFASHGGTWAMKRKYFWDIGAYDTGMKGWGGEDLEIALRVWMCGGRVELLPCSRVGHVYRHGKRPYKAEITNENPEWNFQRTAETWMDEYKNFFYMIHPAYKNKDFGDVSDRLKLRRQLGCKSFKWFLENIAMHKLAEFDIIRAGQVITSNSLCLDSLGGDNGSNLGLYPCNEPSSSSQVLMLMGNGHLRLNTICAIYEHDKAGKNIKMSDCPSSLTHKWTYKENTGQVIHEKTGFCLDGDIGSKIGHVLMKQCNNSTYQQWKWDNSLET